jgi:hypothetical protein
MTRKHAASSSTASAASPAHLVTDLCKHDITAATPPIAASWQGFKGLGDRFEEGALRDMDADVAAAVATGGSSFSV